MTIPQDVAASTDSYSEMTPSLLAVFILKCATKVCTCKLHAVGLRAEGGIPPQYSWTVIIIIFVGHHLATKVFIGKLPSMGWV